MHELIEPMLLVLPVFLPIVVGYGLKYIDFPPQSFWPMAEKLTYYLLLPCLIANAIATGDLGAIDPGPIVSVMLAGIATMVSILFVGKRVFGIDGPAFGSIFHSCIRPNGYMGIAVSLALLGQTALPQISIVVSVWVPVGLILAVYVFLRESGTEQASLRRIALQTARNPLVLSVVAGLSLNAVGAGSFLRQAPLLDVIGRAALPVGLLAVGAGLDLGAMRLAGSRVLMATVLKLIGFPALLTSLSVIFGIFGSTAAAVVIVFAAMPTSPSGYIMATQMGGDAKLMASVIAVQTAVSLLTITVLLWLLA